MGFGTMDRERRNAVLRRLGVQPSIGLLVHRALAAAIDEAELRSPGAVEVLDAGCGRKSPLVPFRGRIHRLVGVDIHAPADPPSYLDAFATVDLCRDADAFADGSFDVILSNFTLEHFVRPRTALATLHRWLRPGGALVVTTVNRRHPFVATYLGLPPAVRGRLQPLIKASAADAHPLVGACNDPALIRACLTEAGFERIHLETVGNLGRAWGRHPPSFVLGAAGDVIAQGMPSRRSTILASARRRQVDATRDAVPIPGRSMEPA